MMNMQKPTARECFEMGVTCYRNGEFTDAVRCFMDGLLEDQHDFEMRLYLGMSLFRLGQTREAKQEFLSVRDCAPDQETRKKATAALQILMNQMNPPHPPKKP